LRLRVNFRITLLTDSITFVVAIALRIAGWKSNSATRSVHRSRHCLTIVGYFWPHTSANFSSSASASPAVADW
jgi:hypothetical protein